MSRTVLLLLFAAVAYIGMSEAAAKCGRNEHFKVCASACEPKCGEPHVECIEECVEPACQCLEGYVRKSNGKCVKPNQC
ncbi:chymotrypsin inhibitor-like [Augochlora pura]